MLVLEATSERQGERDGDYHWCEEGELAYSPGLACDCPDCGCGRGWAGLASRRATTTVKVAERSDLTAGELARQLASALCNSGWITTPDPSDEMVASLVDEVITTANHFGEGSVLERDGEWVRKRDGTNEPVNPIDRLGLEQLTADLDDASPMHILSVAANLVQSSGKLTEPLIASLNECDWPEAQALGCALETLYGQSSFYSWEDAPGWLRQLGTATISETRRRIHDGRTSYLVEVATAERLVGVLWFQIDNAGEMIDVCMVDDSISQFCQLMKVVERRPQAYRKVSVGTARKAIVSAVLNEADRAESERKRWQKWPLNKPLVDFVLEELTWT